MERTTNLGQILMPRDFVIKDLDVDKGTLLLFYSYICRYSTFDGLFSSSIEDICQNLGSTFDKQKNRHVPMLAKKIIECLDYMSLQEVITLKKGDYRDIYKIFTIQIDSQYLNIKKNYIPITFANFDYVLNKAGKDKKANLFMLLYWILNISTKNEDGVIIYACSYSIAYICRKLHFSPSSTCRYLGILCGTKNTTAPLSRFKTASRKVDGVYRGFASIYVRNNEDAYKNYELQRDFIVRHFWGQINETVTESNTDFVQDIDDFYEY